MASFRVNASLFPRQGEAKARCLMTVGDNLSGSGAALIKESGDYPGWSTYMFLRLTRYSVSADPSRWPASGSVAGTFSSEGQATECGVFDSAITPTLVFGAFRKPDIGGQQVDFNHAPSEPTPELSWSTITPVDKAGWTEVVIQGGPRVLSDVSIGCFAAKVNASINDVAATAPRSGQQLRYSGDGTVSDGTCGCLGFSEADSSSISCPNNNEVTI